MDEELEGALNEADASPADSTDETETLEITDNGFEPADDAQDDGADQSLNDGAADEDGEEQLPEHVPYTRFKEVNERAQQEAQARQELEARYAEAEAAANLGIPLPQYQAIQQEAQQYGFADVPTYLAAVQEHQQRDIYIQHLQQQLQEVEARHDLDPEVKNQWANLLKHEENLVKQQGMVAAQSEAINRSLQAQEKAAKQAVIADAEKTFGKIDPELQHILTVARSDEARVIVDSMKKMLGPAKAAAVAEYNGQKARDRQQARVEGRGGRAAPITTQAPFDPKSASVANLLRAQAHKA